MRRRDFIAIIGGLTLSPLYTRAQQRAVSMIGFLGLASAANYAPFVLAFHEGLKSEGYVEGQNLKIEYRWAEGHHDRLPALAAELVQLGVGLMVTSGGNSVARAARSASGTIPIVFATGSDPVKDGLVASLNRPGGNLTGVFLITNSLIAKRIELLREMLGKATTVAMLADPTGANFQTDTEEAEAAASAQSLRLLVFEVSAEAELEAAFDKLARAHAEGLIVEASAIFTGWRERIIALAARHAVPAVFEWPDFATAGGLASYGTSLADGYRQLGITAGRIIKGEKPADLPVAQPTKVELVVNLKTARSLGLVIPQSVLARADEVIE